MRIVQLATEFAPIAKAGGLGEVIIGLSKELSLLGFDIDVILPKYDFLDAKQLSHIKMETPDFQCFEKGTLHPNAMWSAVCKGVKLHLLEARHPAGYFHRNQIYGCEDDTARFLYFSRAALEFLKLQNRPIDILHLHDWHVAIAAVLARDLFQLPIKAILLTIHNAEYQGKCATWDLDAIGLKGADYLTPDKMQDDHPSHSKLINLLKGGIVYADAVNAVSPTYAKEILTEEIGFHLDPTFRKYKSKLTGILNGLDLELWDPGFRASDSIEAIAKAKELSRNKLRQLFSLSKHHRPWVGAVTRLAAQKGPDLLEEALRQTIRLGGTFVLLGSSSAHKLQTHFEKLKTKYAGNNQLLLHLAYDETLARHVYNALDFLLIPSLYEPCGLTQMIGMRYGTIPIARATGGLKDTIFDVDNPHVASNLRNGLLFPNYNAISMTEKLEKAFQIFRQNPELMQVLVKNGIHRDWSWKKPAQEYVKLYQKILRGR